ncbi:MAG TPA: type I restriction endonuclease subunit R [Alphaproteobacteria bacterium]|nr:type I restriction endonuclease subunit R [Alphaproteobacteria bacterium]
MTKFNIVAENPKSTVVSEYAPLAKNAASFQSEADLEREFINQLAEQAYERVNITSDSDLVQNLRKQLSKLNNYDFSNSEWDRFFTNIIANKNAGIKEKTKIIQEDHVQILKRDDGTDKNIKLIDKDSIHNNHLQVLNQYETESGQRSNRYDVTVLVNGLPLVHIELKKRGVDIKEAFNQINRYNRESFWADSGLFEYVQLFVISNGTFTKYYSNTTRDQHINEVKESSSKSKKQTSNSFEFTSWWADANNKPITDLIDFAKTFFAKHTILNILTRYCVFTSDGLLLVMRPYQIVATERIINRIEIAHNYEKKGTIDAGGYIWHTTGSGKTLTSFKTAQLATKLPFIKKVMFVVDRKDLDYQTMKEYDKFEKGAANSNTNTSALKKNLENPDSKILITTIQKLDKFIKKNKGHEIFNDDIVLIFDECHRSQFGDMHDSIVKSFKNYYLFGFTGTPIFAENASSGGHPDLKTTEQAFGEKLHTYTIVDAINDKNVLPFRIDYVSTMRQAEDIDDKQVLDIDRERILASPERVSKITKYILEHFDQKTKRNTFYKVQDRRLNGFNSIFAVASIDMAKAYYAEFKKQMADLPSDKRLKIATIYSFGVNEEDGIIDENSENTDGLDVSSRDFLDNAIKDYNETFKSNYNTSAKEFQNYYKDVSAKVKNRELDLLIVVNMFLTGFDATTLNTLWVDKNLRLHGLLQAFSRTNRILNSVKTFGNIVCFRNLEKATNESIGLFGDKEAAGMVLLKTFDEYFYGYDNNGKPVRGYEDLVKELTEKYPIDVQIIGEKNKKEFIRLYGAILKLRNILTTFDEFSEKDILTPRDVQDYHSMYIDLYNEFRNQTKANKENVNDDIVFEMELIKQVEINIDYILELIRKYHDSHMLNKEILVNINKAIDSSVEMRNKKELILQFISNLDVGSHIDDDWHKFIDKSKIEELDKIISDENLKKDETYAFIKNSFRDGTVQITGTDITKILPNISRFSKDSNRAEKKETVIQKIQFFFNKFFDISGNKF